MATTKHKKPGSRAVNTATTGKPNQARTRRTLRTHPRVIAFAVGAAFAPWILGPAFADPAPNQLPTGGQVGAGAVTMSTAGTKMQIDQASDKAIINWNCFCIGSNAWVNFNQPSASAVVLNRSIQGAEIFGRMSANGQVFVTSSAGVYFGRTAQVDVGGLMASSLSIRDQDFLAGRYLFSKEGSAGEVVNEGRIVAVGGYAALAGPQVRNNGIIVAQAGTVALAAGDRVSLDMIGDGLVKVSVDAAALNALALNAGTLQADGGRVVLTARSANALLDTVINNTGVIRATTVSERGGEIVLDGGDRGVVANSGTLTAAGTDAGTVGGTIRILGERVALWDGTRIDASGDAGGGTVLVGGNFQGRGPEQNATVAYVGRDAAINVDAINTGNGGNAVVWSDNTTRFYGSISARGGAQSGNGGSVEVSGKQYLAFHGSVDTRAPHGQTGTLLLDPADIEIRGGTGDGDDNAASGEGGGEDTTFKGTASAAGTVLGTDATPTVIFQSELEGIGQNTNISIQATNNITFNAAGFAFTNNRVDFAQNGGNSVTLDAGNTLAINSVGITTNGGTLTLIAGAGGITDIGTISGAPTVTLNTTGTANQTGTITATTIDLRGTGGTFNLDTQNNAVTNLKADTDTVASVAFRDDTGFAVQGITASTGVTLQTNNTVTQTAAITTPALTLTSTTGGTGTFSLTNAGNDLGTVSSTNQISTATLRDDTGFSLGALNVATAVTLRTDGTVTQTGALTGGAIVVLTATTAGQGTFTLDNAGNDLGQVSSSNQVNTVSLRDDTAFSLAALNAATSVTLQTGTGGAVTQTGVLTTPLLTLTGTTAGEGNFTLNSQNNVLGTVTSTNTVNTVALRDDGGLTLGALAADTTVTLRTNGAVTQTGALTGNAAVVLTATTAGQGTFTLTDAGNNFGAVSSTNQVNTVSLRDDGGFSIGATGLNAATSITLQTNGTAGNAVTQAGVLTTPQLNLTASTAGSGDFTLNSQNNAAGTVTVTNQVNAVAYRQDSSFAIGPIDAVASIGLTSNGTVTQTGAFTTPGTLTLTSTAGNTGTFTLTNAGNNVGTLSTTNNVAAVSFRDDTGFAVGGASGLSGTSVTLQTDGTVTNTGVLTAPTLTLTATAAGNGDFTLNTQSNALTNVAVTNQVNSVALRDDGNFAVGAINAVTSIALQSNGTVTQTGVLTTPLLTLTGTAAGSGDFTLNSQNNVLGTVTSTNTVNTVALRDDGGLTLGALAADTTVTLRTNGAVTQTGALTGNAAVVLTATTAGQGTFTLTDAGNNFGAVSSTNQVNTVSLRDDGGFSIGATGLNAATSITLQTNGTAGNAVTQAGVLTTPQLNLTASTAGSGDFTLNSQNNAAGTVTVTNQVNAVAYRQDSSFAIGPIDAVASIGLTSNGTVTQAGAFTTPALNLTSTTVGGTFTLTNAGNEVGTLSTTNNVVAVSFRDDTGFAVGALNAGTSVTLQTNGTVTQTGVLTTPTLNLTASTAGSGNFTLNTQNNALTNVAVTNQVNSVALRDDGGFAVGAVDAVASIGLTSNSTVTQTGAFTTPALNLTATTPGSGTFTLTNAGNEVGTLGSTNQVGTVSFRDDTGFAVGALNAATSVTLQTNGTVTQTGALTGGAAVVLTATTAGSGTFTLTNAGNNFGQVSSTNQVNTVSLRDDGGFSVGTLSAANNINLQTNGTVTQAGVITTPATLNLTASTAGNNGTFTLNSQNNAVGTVAVTNQVNAVAYRQDSSFAIGPIDAVTSIGLTSNNTVTQAGAFTTAALALTSTAGNTGTFTLTNAGNNVGTLSSTNNVAAVSFRDDTGFAVGTLSGTAVTLQTNGTVTNTGVLTAPTLTLTATAAGSGDFTLNTQANVLGTVAVTNQVNSVALRDDGGFSVGAIDAVTSIGLTSNSTVTQTGALTAAGLQLLGTGGTFTLTNPANNVATIAAGGTNTISYRDADTLTVGTVNGTNGIASGGANVTLQTGTDLAITQALNAGAGTVNLIVGGAISQTALGAITAATLTGSAGTAAILDQGNAVTNLGAFTANGFTLNDAGGLTLTGNVDGLAGAVTITTTNGALGLSTHSVIAGTDVTLSATGNAGAISNAAGGVITATAGAVQLDAGQNVTLAAPVTAGTSVDVNFGISAGGTFNANAGAALNAGTTRTVTSGSAGANAFNINTPITAALVGGSAADTFTLNAVLTGSVTGNAGSDTLAGTQVTSVTLAASDATGFSGTTPVTFSGIDTINGTGQTLTGEATASTWTFNGAIGTYNDGTHILNFAIGGAGFTTFNAGASAGDAFTVASASTATLNGNTGADTFNINAALTGAVSGGAGIDILQGTQISAVALTGSSAANGFSGNSNGVTSFSGINTINGTGTLTGENVAGGTWTLNGATGTYNDITATLTYNVAGFTTLQAGTAGDAFTVAAATGAVALNGGTGADTFNINAAFTGSANGGAGNDTLLGSQIGSVTLTSSSAANGFSGNAPMAFTGMNAITGTGTLTGDNSLSTWALNGATGTYNDGTAALNFAIGAGPGFNVFTGGSGGNTFTVASATTATLNGGTGADTFTLNAVLTGSVAGNAGNDTLQGTQIANVTLQASNANGFSGITPITFSGINVINGTGSLTGENVASTWTLNGATSSYFDGTNTLNFNAGGGFTTVNGGSGGDTFNIAGATTTTLNGGAGNDNFNLAGGSLTGAVNGGGGTNTLTGSTAYNVTAANAGTATGVSGGFTGISSLTGTGGSDTFTISTGSLSGSINGSPGTDTLSYAGNPGAVAINLQTSTATGIAGGFVSIESFAGNGNGTTLTGPAGATTYVSSGSNSGSAGATPFSNVGNIIAGPAQDTITSLVLTGSFNDGGGGTILNGNISAGGNITFGGAVTNPGNIDLIIAAGANLTPGTMNVGSGRIQLFAGGTIIGGAGQSVTGTSTQQNVMSSGVNVAAVNVDFSNQVLLLTGAATQWDLTGPPVVGTGSPPVFQVGSGATTVRYNGTLVVGAAVSAIQASTSLIGATLAEISRAALLEAQDTDSVQKQIEYGFAGDVGTTPPMDHRIDETGISVPRCFNDSREGQTCQ